MKRNGGRGKMPVAERGGRADDVPTQLRPTEDVGQDQTKRSKTPNTASKITTGDSDRLATVEANLDQVMTLINSLCRGREERGRGGNGRNIG